MFELSRYHSLYKENALARGRCLEFMFRKQMDALVYEVLVFEFPILWDDWRFGYECMPLAYGVACIWGMKGCPCLWGVLYLENEGMPQPLGGLCLRNERMPQLVGCLVFGEWKDAPSCGVTCTWKMKEFPSLWVACDSRKDIWPNAFGFKGGECLINFKVKAQKIPHLGD